MPRKLSENSTIYSTETVLDLGQVPVDTQIYVRKFECDLLIVWVDCCHVHSQVYGTGESGLNLVTLPLGILKCKTYLFVDDGMFSEQNNFSWGTDMNTIRSHMKELA